MSRCSWWHVVMWVSRVHTIINTTYYWLTLNGKRVRNDACMGVKCSSTTSSVSQASELHGATANWPFLGNVRQLLGSWMVLVTSATCKSRLLQTQRSISRLTRLALQAWVLIHGNQTGALGIISQWPYHWQHSFLVLYYPSVRINFNNRSSQFCFVY